MNKKEFVPLIGNEDKYKINGYGEIIHYVRFRLADNSIIDTRPRLLHPSILNGFYVVQINRRTEYVHKLVMLTFNPNHRLDRTMIFHIDGNKLNNDIDNLIWVNVSERSEWSKASIQERVRNMRIKLE